MGFYLKIRLRPFPSPDLAMFVNDNLVEQLDDIRNTRARVVDLICSKLN